MIRVNNSEVCVSVYRDDKWRRVGLIYIRHPYLYIITDHVANVGLEKHTPTNILLPLKYYFL